MSAQRPSGALCALASLVLLLLASPLPGCSGGDADADAAIDADATDAQADATSDATDPDVAPAPPVTLRVATFNASLFRTRSGELANDLLGGDDPQARAVAEVLQRVRPDVILLNELDWDGSDLAATRFAQEYLTVSQNGAEPLALPYRHVPPTNTGLHSGVDLNNDGQLTTTPGTQAYGDDAFGFGAFRGQYGMVVYARYPIAAADLRQFQTLLWREVPDSLLPTDWYSAEAVEVLRLSSKNHVDLPLDVAGHTLHLLISHPTPPSFDGPEDRNGRRNHDEVRFWVDYISGGAQAAYIHDDAGDRGGLDPDAAFVLLGDLNSDPLDGDSRRDALLSLLDHPRLHDPRPTSDGAAAAARDGQANATHAGDPRLDTADFSDHAVGNLRVDFALPSSNLTLHDAGVFWPAADDPHADLADTSDHHLVWIDITIGQTTPSP